VKIGMVCYPTLGGSGAIASRLGVALACRGHQVHFISYGIPFHLEGFHEGIRYHAVEVSSYPLFKYPPYDMALACRIMEVQKHCHLDLLHVHYAIPHAISAYLARQMLPEHPVKVVTTLHGTDITIVGHERSYYEATRFGIEKSDGVTSVSQYLRIETERKLHTTRPIQVIPNFVDPDRLRPVSDAAIRNRYARPGETLVVHVSNFRPVKRVLDAIEVFGRISRARPSRFLLVGDGPELPRAANLAHDLGLDDRIAFLGAQSGIETLLGVSDLFLLPTDTESFGLAALEAMSCGVPVIGTRTGGLPEVITDGEDGFLCDVGDVVCMAEKALSLLDDPSLHRSFREKARRKAIESFHVDLVAPRYEEYYTRIIGGDA